MGNAQLYAYDVNNRSGVNRNLNPPSSFTAPNYVWKPASGNKPGENVFLCFLYDENRKRDCCF